MGMVLSIRTLSDGNIRNVLADPPLIWQVVAPDMPELYEEARRQKPGLLSRLFGSRNAPNAAQAAPLTLADGEGNEANVDKAWHGLHYLLTQTAYEGTMPLNFLVAGGTEAGSIDVGYGPARMFTADQVKAIDIALRPIDAAFLTKRFDPAEMMRLKIYPEFWDRDPDDDDVLGYCIAIFDEMKAFISEAAARSLGIVVSVS